MASVAVPAIIAGGILGGYSQWKQGQEASRNATIAAAQMEEAAQISEQNARRQKATAQRAARETLRKNRLVQSRQIAIAAKGGQTGSKNVSDLLSRTQSMGEYAASVNLYEGDLRADSFFNQAISQRRQASAILSQGRSARRAGNIGFITSLLNAGGTASSFQAKYGNGGFNSTAANTSPFNNSANSVGFNYQPLQY